MLESSLGRGRELVSSANSGDASVWNCPHPATIASPNLPSSPPLPCDCLGWENRVAHSCQFLCWWPTDLKGWSWPQALAEEERDPHSPVEWRSLALSCSRGSVTWRVYNFENTILFFTICLKQKKSNIQPDKILTNGRVHFAFLCDNWCGIRILTKGGQRKQEAQLEKGSSQLEEYKRIFLRFQISKIQNTMNTHRPCQSFLQSSSFRTESTLHSKHTGQYL